MASQVEAILTGGVLKPDQPLPFADQTRVRLTVEPVEDRPSSVAAWEELERWIVQHPFHGLGRRLTRDELHERR